MSRWQETFALPARLEAAAVQDLAENEFVGMAAVFGNRLESFVPTIIERGAFRATLEKDADRIRILWQHDPAAPIGRPVELKETPEGLFIRGRLATTLRAREALELMREGILDELSIGFDPVRWESRRDPATGEDVRYLQELRLWEISLVTFAADPLAKIAATAECHSVNGKILDLERLAHDTGIQLQPLQPPTRPTEEELSPDEVPGLVRRAAEVAVTHTCRELGLAPPALHWVRAFGDGSHGGEMRLVDGSPVIFLRADVTPRQAFETALHETRHAFQHGDGHPVRACDYDGHEADARAFTESFLWQHPGLMETMCASYAIRCR